MKFFRFRTSRDEVVCAEDGSGRLLNTTYDSLDERHVPVIAARLNDDDRFIFVASAVAEALPIRCDNLGLPAPFLPLMAYETGREEIYNLVSFENGLYLCAPPVNSDDTEHVISANRREARQWEEFRLTEVALPERFTYLRDRLEALAPVLRSLMVDVDIAGAVKQMKPDLVDTVNGVLPIVGEKRLNAFASQLFADPKIAETFAAKFPDDIWAKHGFVELLKAARERPGHSIREIDSSFDAITKAARDRVYRSLPHACASAARRMVEPTKNACIVATARNEGIYLIEWLAHHRVLGFEKIFIYSNDNDDQSDLLLAALAEAGEIVWIRNLVAEGGAAQLKAYGHAFGILPDILDYRWCLTIDMDEYFVVNPARFSSVIDYLDWQERQDVDAIALNWVFIGPTGESHWRDLPLRERFVDQLGNPAVDAHVKSLCKPRKFIYSEPHFPIAPVKSTILFRDSTSALHSHQKASAHSGIYGTALSDNPNRDFACIYHYFFKSAEEFLWKFSRNRGDYAKKTGRDGISITKEFLRDFMEFYTPRHAMRNDWITRCASGLGEEMARLEGIAGVADAIEAVKAAFHARIAEFKPIFAETAAIKDAGEAGQAFLKLIGDTSAQSPPMPDE
ncbi:glycosyltransferase family 2 protein [Rhizobium sp. G21]|uniref:glycosyltransferase family 2 protein n=1 Tax=Rhizobium sp. G21 TaxID=2758439 RepID=UPI001604415B|nr:glycosyltransferase family 2 protein [Rhizobium sp. G21]MBB1250730.1 glycosyltransferase family 2 protein [Rhizobium sp. G21]